MSDYDGDDIWDITLPVYQEQTFHGNLEMDIVIIGMGVLTGKLISLN